MTFRDITNEVIGPVTIIIGGIQDGAGIAILNGRIKIIGPNSPLIAEIQRLART